MFLTPEPYETTCFRTNECACWLTHNFRGAALCKGVGQAHASQENCASAGCARRRSSKEKLCGAAEGLEIRPTQLCIARPLFPNFLQDGT